MSKSKDEMISEYLHALAEKEGLAGNDARNEIALAVSLALKSSDPRIQHFWKEIPCAGESPTIEEMIDYINSGISTQE